MQVLAIAGSLRAGSFNRMLLDRAESLAPPEMAIERFERLGEIPPFDGDVLAEGDPPVVAELKAALARADGLLLVSPEYNFGPPGVLKNAIDWASTPRGNAVTKGLPVALMGTSPGQQGTARGQFQLRENLIGAQAHVVLEPEVLVAHARTKFAGGALDDPVADELIRELLANLVDLARRLGDKERT